MTSGFDTAISYANTALKIAGKAGDSSGIVGIYSSLGVSNWNMSRYNEALKLYLKGLKYCRTPSDYSVLYNNIGLVYWDKGELSTALNYFLLSYELDEQLNNLDGMSSSLLNIGLIYDDLKDWKNALKYYFKSFSICKKIKDEKGMALCYNNIGKVYGSNNDTYKAMDYYVKSYNISKRIEDKRNMAMAGNNIGTLYLDKGNFEEAWKYFDQSFNLYKTIGDVSGMLLPMGNLGDLYNRKQDYAKAEAMLKEQLRICIENEFLDDQVLAYKGLSIAQAGQGKYKEAYESSTKYNQLNDSLSKLNNVSSLNDIQKNYELKQKEKENNIKRDADKAIASSEKRRQNFVIVAVIVILLVVIVFSFFLFKRFKITKQQKEIIEKQKEIVEDQRKEVLDSIRYAKRIQNTIIASDEFLDQHLPEHFVFFKPKDIVSGDFYWATETERSSLQGQPGYKLSTIDHKLFYLAVCDSTGHGVPGAFMSLLNIGFLSEAINEKKITETNQILDYARKRLIGSVSKDGQKDGFDGILVCFEKEGTTNKKITYSAAYNSPVLISEGKIIELGVDKMPVGQGERTEPFTLHNIEFKKGDVLYLYTDGFADQFGGEKGKKFKYKQLNELLLANYAKPCSEQKEIFSSAFDTWKGTLEQVDDVCIIGIRL
jgi:tetratricopeptide (TPR) repeat protein